ncbi:alpha/beta hydrolase [Intestinibacillus massiliensis]|nr:alpha/beta hydrolase [Intestinibacillus massiliensis]
MAINKYMKAVLRALSYPDIDMKRHYLLVRQATRISHPPLPQEYVTFPFSVTNGDHEVPCRLFTPHDKAEPLPLLLFAHGGGWIAGDVDTYSRVCYTMAAQTGCMVLSVDYRLAPEHPFPAGFDDFYAVARTLFTDPFLPVRPEAITLIGDSAGGNLCAAASLKARDTGDFTPRRQILIYPACASEHDPALSAFPSLRENGEGYLLTTKRVCEYMDLYCADRRDRQNPYFAPLAAVDLSRQPKTLIITAQYDPLRDEGEAYGARLLADGNQVTARRMPDALHGFFSLPPRFPSVRQCYKHICDFLCEVPE